MKKYLIALGFVVIFLGVANAEYIVSVAGENLVRIVDTTISDRTVDRETEISALMSSQLEIDKEIYDCEMNIAAYESHKRALQQKREYFQARIDAINAAVEE